MAVNSTFDPPVLTPAVDCTLTVVGGVTPAVPDHMTTLQFEAVLVSICLVQVIAVPVLLTVQAEESKTSA